MKPLDPEEVAALHDRSSGITIDIADVRPERLAAEDRLVERGLAIRVVEREGGDTVVEYRRSTFHCELALRAHAAWRALVAFTEGAADYPARGCGPGGLRARVGGLFAPNLDRQVFQQPTKAPDDLHGETMASVARGYAVSASAVERVATGRTWAHHPGPVVAKSYRAPVCAEEVVSAVRRLRGDGVIQADIARNLGLSQSVVSRIVRGERHAIR